MNADIVVIAVCGHAFNLPLTMHGPTNVDLINAAWRVVCPPCGSVLTDPHRYADPNVPSKPIDEPR